MIIPIEQVTTALSTLYYDTNIRVLISSFIHIQGLLNVWSPYMIIGTRQHFIIANFNPKDDKQIKVFNRREVKIVECEEERIIKSYDNVMQVTINQDDFLVKFASLQDQRNWTFFLQAGVAPVIQLEQHSADVYEREGYQLSLSACQDYSFSELQQATYQSPSFLAQKGSIYFNIGDLCKIFTESQCSYGLLLNQGNLVYRFFSQNNVILPTNERFYNVRDHLYKLLRNVYVDVKEEQKRAEKILDRKYQFETRDWQQEYVARMQEVSDLYGQYVAFQPAERPQDYAEREQPPSVYDISDPTELPQPLIDRLRHQLYSRSNERELRGITQVQRPSLTRALCSLLQLFQDFQARCEEVAVTLIDEFPLPSHEQQYLDKKVEQNDQTMKYLLNQYRKQYLKFQKFAQQLDPFSLQQLENQMTQFGPVHGSILANFGPALRQYQALLMQPKTFIAGTRLSAPPVGPGEDPIFENGQANGFPDGLIETTTDEFLFQQNRAIYPNQLPPVFEVNNTGIQFIFAACNEHQQMNIRRDSWEIAERDNQTIDMLERELKVIQSFNNASQQSPAEIAKILAPMTCSIKYCGFTVQCQAQFTNPVQTFCFQPNGSYNYPEEIEAELKQLALSFNIQPHLIMANANISSPLLKEPIDPSFIIQTAQNLDKYDGFSRFSKFLQNNSFDIAAQLSFVQQIQVDDQNQLFSVYLSSMTQLFKDRGYYYIKNLQALQIPDMPTLFLNNILPSMQSKRKTVQDQLAQIAQTCKLPISYIQLIDEKINPDLCLIGLKVDSDQLGMVTEAIKNAFNTLNDNQVNQLDKNLFQKFLVFQLSEYQYNNSIIQTQRWSDTYRVQYLPLLAHFIDFEILSGNLQIGEVVEIFEYFQVPTYLWLYTANLSQLQEVQQVVKLAVAGRAISRYLDDSLRKLLRTIQQYGIQEAFTLNLDKVKERKKDKRAEQEMRQMLALEQQFFAASNKYEAQEITQRLKMKQMNFFTTQTKEERLQFIEQYRKQFIAMFLNQIFCIDSDSKFVWDSVNRIIELFYYDHSFAIQYTQIVQNTQFGKENQVARFVFNKINPTTLFCDNLSKGEINKNYRLLLLDNICRYSGVQINDLNTYQFNQKTSIFKYSDVICFSSIVKTPVPGFIAENANVPFRPWLSVAQRIKRNIANNFSYSQQYTYEVEKFADIQNKFLLKNQLFFEDQSSLIFKQLNYNVAFTKLTNLSYYNQFEYLLCATAIHIVNKIRTQFTCLYKADRLQTITPLIRHYIETKETAILLVSAALAIAKRNSLLGIKIYNNYSQLFNIIQQFEFQLQQCNPEVLSAINREVQYNASFISDDRLFQQFTSELEAFQMSQIACQNILGDGSIELSKLLAQEAAHLYQLAQYDQAIQLLTQAEDITIAKNGNTCVLLLEIYNLHGICQMRLKNAAKAQQFFDKAVVIIKFYSEKFKQQLQLLSQQQQQLEQLEASGDKLASQQQIQLKFTQADNQQIIENFNQQFVAIEIQEQEEQNAFTYPAGQQSYQKASYFARMVAERIQGVKSVFSDIQIKSFDILCQSNPEIKISAASKADQAYNSRLQYILQEYDQMQLFYSQILENQAKVGLICEQKDPKYKNFAISALKLRSQILSKQHIFTLKALLTICEFDANDKNKQLTSIEFCLRNIEDQVIQDLNPVIEERIDKFALFKKLFNAVTKNLPEDMENILGQAYQTAKKQKFQGNQLVMQAMQEICNSNNIAGEIVNVIQNAIKYDKDSVTKLVYLVQMVQENPRIETRTEFNDQGGVDRHQFDLVEALQQKGRNEVLKSQFQEQFQDDDDW